MLELVAIVLGGITTFVTRALFLVSGKLRPPKRVEKYLPLVGPAVLGAIAIPGIILVGGNGFSPIDAVPAVIAGAAAWVVWAWTKQTWIALVASLGLWWALLALMALLGITG